MTTTIDHIIIAVKNLAKATQDMTTLLGRQPSWQGSHPDYGSANSLFRLDNTYVELLYAGEKSLFSKRVNQHIAAHGEGLFGIIFGHENLARLGKHMQTLGYNDIKEPLPGHGVDTRTGATRSWQTAFWGPDTARGIFSFAICHDDSQKLPLAPVKDKGPICAVDHVVVQTHDGGAAEKFYGTALGLRLALKQSRPQWGGTMMFFRASHMSLEVVVNKKYDKARDHLWGIAFTTKDIQASHQRLMDNNVAVSPIRQGRKAGTRVCTVKSHNVNVPVLLLAHEHHGKP